MNDNVTELFGSGLIHTDHLTDEQVVMIAKMFEEKE